MNEIIRSNLAGVKTRISQAAERIRKSPDEITLVAVTKTVSPDIIKILGECGQRDIGENRVQEGIAKANRLPQNVFNWHLIGHLQTNKVKKALAVFGMVHALDSLKLAETIRQEAEKLNKYIRCLIEVNVSGEESKFGIKPESLFEFYQQVVGRNSGTGGIIISGLMTMAPIIPAGNSTETCRPYFRQLKELLDELKSRAAEINRPELKYLSMGMSQDFEVAIDEGANIIRVGSALLENL